MANIGYFDPEDISKPIRERLAVPLSNLHWKLPNQPLKSINQLELRFHRNSAIGASSKQAGNVEKQNDQFYHSLILEANNNILPYVQLFFVKSKSIDDYRARARPAIRTWVDHHVNNRIIAPKWLIILVEDDNSPLSRSGLFSKLETDFNEEGECNCVKVQSTYSNEAQRRDDWSTLVSVLKSKILSSCSGRLSLYISQLALLDERPVMNPYFKIILKSYLMKVYSDMTLVEESIRECDDMVKSFTKFNEEHAFEFPVSSDTIDLTQFHSNKAFDMSINFDQMILERKMNQLQFYCLSFLHVSRCSMALAAADSTLSFSTMHVIELLRRVKCFTRTLDDLWISTESIPSRIYEFQYAIIEEFLSNDSVLKILDLNSASPEGGRFADLIEFIGELRLTQRELMSELASLAGYQIEQIMSSIPLMDRIADYHGAQIDPLRQALASQLAFEEEYIRMTKSIIEIFSLAEVRPRTIDNLSTELALISYNKNRYGETIALLKGLFKYYQDSGWDHIGSHLLKIYVSCLEEVKTEDRNELLLGYLELLATRKLTEKEAEKLSLKVSELSEHTHLRFSASKLVNISIDSKWHHGGTNQYFVKLSIENSAKLHMTLNQLSLAAEDHEGNVINFEAKGADLKNLRIDAELFTNDFYAEEYYFKTLYLKINGLVLEHEIGDWYTGEPSAFAASDNIIAKLSIPMNRKLNQNTMDLNIQNASATIENLTIKVLSKKVNSGFSFQETGAAISSNGNQDLALKPLEMGEEALTFVCEGKIMAHSAVKLTIPYSFQTQKAQENSVVHINYHISFIQNGTPHNYIAKESLDTSLSIAVTVQDIFRSSIFFTNFSIGSADSKCPVRIINVDLHTAELDNRNYEIRATNSCSKPMVAFGGQPAKFFYRIEKSTEAVSGEELVLDVKYRSLKEECKAIFETVFQKHASKETGNFNAIRLMDKIAPYLQFKLALYSFNNTLRLEEILVEYLHLPREETTFLKKFLKPFMEANGYNAGDHDLCDLTRSLEISVPMPVVPFIHEAELAFERQSDYMVGAPINATLLLKSSTSWSGKPPLSQSQDTADEADDLTEKSSTASLRPPTPILSRPTSPGLETTSTFATTGNGKYWENTTKHDNSTSTVDLNMEYQKSKRKGKAVSFATEAKNNKSFAVELQTQDGWLISGRKKFIFQLRPNGSHEFTMEPMPVTLIPLKIGKLSLPKIDITFLDNNEAGSDVSSLEVDYKNSSESLVIVSDVDKVTFEL